MGYEKEAKWYDRVPDSKRFSLTLYLLRNNLIGIKRIKDERFTQCAVIISSKMKLARNLKWIFTISILMFFILNPLIYKINFNIIIYFCLVDFFCVLEETKNSKWIYISYIILKKTICLNKLKVMNESRIFLNLNINLLNYSIV